MVDLVGSTPSSSIIVAGYSATALILYFKQNLIKTMNDFELNFIVIIVILGYIGSGLLMGYSIDKTKKDPITAFLDGYIIFLPMIMMVALGAPVFLALYGIIGVVYSVIIVVLTDTTIKETMYSDVTGPSYFFFGYLCLFVFWVYFRKKVLGYENIF